MRGTSRVDLRSFVTERHGAISALMQANEREHVRAMNTAYRRTGTSSVDGI